MPTRHTLTHADNIYAGDAFYQKYTPDGRHGVAVPHLYAHKFGAVTTLDADGITTGTGGFSTGVGTAFSATGALVSGGVATFDIARCLTMSATFAASTFTITVNGTDSYGETMTEALAGPSQTATITGQKAFKTVTSITATLAFGSALTIGSSDTFGVPVRIPTKGDVVCESIDGATATAKGTITAGFAATGVSTSTTADVRGLYKPGIASDGTKQFTVVINIDHTTKKTAFGVAQA